MDRVIVQERQVTLVHLCCVKGLSKLKKEIEDFEKEKNEELQRLNEFKTQEMKKLK